MSHSTHKAMDPTSHLPLAPRDLMILAVLAGLVACNPRVDEYQERGDQYAAQGEYVDARVEYQLALEEAGGDAPSGLRMKAGDLALRSKTFNEANQLFGELIEDVTIHHMLSHTSGLGGFDFEEIIYELYVLEKIRRGMKDAEEGHVVSHEEAKERLGRWLK